MLLPSHSNERLIDSTAQGQPGGMASVACGGGASPPGGSKSDFEYYTELLPPELARQLMMGELDGERKGDVCFTRKGFVVEPVVLFVAQSSNCSFTFVLWRTTKAEIASSVCSAEWRILSKIQLTSLDTQK